MATTVLAAQQMVFKYSRSEILGMRSLATAVGKLSIELCDEIQLNGSTSKTQKQSPVQQDAVIRFRKEASPKEIKFIEDMDVPITHLVHAYNLSDGVTWPILKTFCEKTVGVPAIDVRMMRRRKPAEARIIFASAEAAQDFLARVPPNIGVKGRCPKFEAESATTRCSPKLDNTFVTTKVEALKSPQSIEIQQASAVAVAHVSEVEDDRCGKVKEVENVHAQEGMVLSAVALDKASPSKTQRGGRTSGGQSTKAKRGGNKSETGTIVGISLAHLRRSSGVELEDVPGRLFQLDTNVTV